MDVTAFINRNVFLNKHVRDQIDKRRECIENLFKMVHPSCLTLDKTIDQSVPFLLSSELAYLLFVFSSQKFFLPTRSLSHTHTKYVSATTSQPFRSRLDFTSASQGSVGRGKQLTRIFYKDDE